MFTRIFGRLFGFFRLQSPPPAEENSEEADCLLEKPWRSVDCSSGMKQRLKDEIREYASSLNSVQNIQVLFLGQINAGKSSFFNSVDSVFRGYVVSQASAGTDDRSVTRKYRTHQVKDGIHGKPLPIIFCDTMGLEEKDSACLKIDDVINIFNGHIPDEYQFNPNDAMHPNTPGYIKSPSLKDQIHCLVFVIDASNVEILPEKIERKLKEIRQKANELELPQLVILTKVDEISSVVNENISLVYRSQTVKRKMNAASKKLGIPLNQIVPVINYHSETELRDDVDVLILMAVRQIMRFAQRYLENFSSDQSPAVD